MPTQFFTAFGGRRDTRPKGFALIVTLSLMILLTVVAVGLLSLSAISMRQSSVSMDRAEAMANAKLSLMLAIGRLQDEMGPDTRISVAADQLPGTTPNVSGSIPERRQWIGIYDAWPTTGDRPVPKFRQWLVSGNPDDLVKVDLVKSSAGTTRELVGKGTLGATATEGIVSVPVTDVKSGNKTMSRYAWWVGDQGIKAAASTARPSPPVDLASVRTGLQGAPRNAVQLARTGLATPFATLPDNDSRLDIVSDFQQMSLLASDPKASAPLFHDLAAHSSGLLTNVRSGGFRKDLSMYLETTVPPTGGFGTNGSLYRINGVDGIRDAELWSYYNLYKQLKSGGISFTSGGSGGGQDNTYLQSEGTAAAARTDYGFYFKRPVIVSYKAMFSFYITPPAGTPATSRLALCVDPVVTFWNPYDVPLSLSPAYNSIRFEKIPYQINGLRVTFKGITTQIGTVRLGGTDDKNFAEKDFNYVTLRAGRNESGGQPLVLKPGEVMVYSQGARTTPAAGGTVALVVPGKPGFNYGGGIFYPLRTTAGAEIIVPADAPQVEVAFGGVSPTKDRIFQGVGGYAPNGTPISVNHTETYLFEDRPPGETVGIGGVFVDYWRGLQPYQAAKPANTRITADQKTDVFKTTSGGTITLASSGTVNDRKKWFFYYAYDVKTEQDALRPGQFMSRFNPSAPAVDFADLSGLELDLAPYEIRIEGNTSSGLNLPTGLETDTTGRGFFGGGLTAADGSTFLSTHSVSREPLVSIAALQHSQANGFNRDKPDETGAFYSSGPTNMSIRLPMLPQISHAIGNSLAPAVLPLDKTEDTLSGRPLADHSYLANKALWDDWFFSGIAPDPATGQTQRAVAEAFLKSSASLPVVRYRSNPVAETADQALNRLFSGNLPKPEATALAASMIRVDGLFNVNSTSVEAWKAVLGGLKNHPVVTRDEQGTQTQTTNTGSTPVAALHSPTSGTADGASVDVKDTAQWTGRRTLDDAQLEALARKLVEEIRSRGPFTSLADFINRRPGSDARFARAGALQSAIDASEINKGHASRTAIASGTLPFPAAESGSPAAQGIAGIVKQADILTPIAPILSVRSDSFIVRGYGEKLDGSGTRVVARAWCEAVVEREPGFVDSSDKPETAISALNPINQRFGRRFAIRSFRWLHPSEI